MKVKRNPEAKVFSKVIEMEEKFHFLSDEKTSNDNNAGNGRA